MITQRDLATANKIVLRFRGALKIEVAELLMDEIAKAIAAERERIIGDIQRIATSYES
jgi:hypothetical protein